MKNLDKLNLGIYEKALPKDIDWVERIKLVKECGYDFVEISKIGRAPRLNSSHSDRSRMPTSA